MRSVLLAVAIVLAPVATSAAPSTHVVVAVTRHDDAPADAPTPEDLGARVVADLRGAGFSVAASSERPPSDADPREWARELAISNGAAIAVLIVLEGTSAEILTHDRVTGKTLFRTVPREIEGANTSVFALATAELVDASLLELERDHETMQPEVEVPPDLPLPPPAPPPAIERGRARFEVEVTAGLVWPVLARRPVAVASPAVAYRPIPRLVIAAEGVLALAPLTGAAQGSVVRSHPFMALLRVGGSVLPARAPVVLEVEAAAGAGVVRVDVDAAEGFVARPTVEATPLVGGGLRLRRDFDPIHIGLRIRSVVPILPPVVEALGDPLHDFGGAWLVADFGVGGHW